MFKVIFTRDRRVLVRRRVDDNRDSLPIDFSLCEEFNSVKEGVYIYEAEGCKCIAEEADEDFSIPPRCRFVALRDSWHQLPYAQYRMACKGAELLNNDRRTRFCGQCGGRLRRSSNGLSKLCDCCGAEYFPQVSPCIIVLVRRGKEALLVHARTFKENRYGLVAGFIETGESVEECVAREVKEETSLEIRNVRYVGSQPWPFPSNLMLGFTADYAGGRLRFADGELTSGGFFSADNLPALPMGASIARMMIEHWKRTLE